MYTISNRLTRVSAALVLGLTIEGCAGTKAPDTRTSGPKAARSGLDVKPVAVQRRAKSSPPESAAQRSSIGMGMVAMKTANAPGERDSYWTEELDIDGNGTAEQTDLLWDDEDKVLFAYAEVDAPCYLGGSASVAILVGVNGKGNSRGRPAGSGFCVAYLDESECGAAAAGLFGCTFDARGNVSAWDTAAVDESGDTVILGGRSR